MEDQQQLHPAFTHDYYLFRKKFFKIFGGAFHVYDPEGDLIFYSRQKAFKLKEDFRIYSDEDMEEELLAIKTPQILDLGATYHVQDSTTGQAIGAIRRKFAKSFIKDEWVFLSTEGRQIGILTESSWIGAIASRIINLIPQTYIVLTETEEEIARIDRHFNPFILKFTMTIDDDDPPIDRRLIIAAGIMLAGIEGRQE